jgi:hypothetical protein
MHRDSPTIVISRADKCSLLARIEPGRSVTLDRMQPVRRLEKRMVSGGHGYSD